MSKFCLSDTPFDPAELRKTLGDPAAGGYASFEGWVRNHNDGRDVIRLEYEAFEALALEEGRRILEEAQARFAILDAACVHRVGALAIAELAVWVGVSAHHREAAFAACRYIIDEVKRRVPIWKKEHYADGNSGWVNCERCAATGGHTHDRAPKPRPDYSRQMVLKEVGLTGQTKLRDSRVLVVGAGGLGVPVLSYLAGAGVGTLDIIDGDRLEASNLHRQPLYALADVGKPKAELAAARLRELNPEVAVHAHVERFSRENAARLLEDCDLAIDCSDNFSTLFLLNDACVLADKPAIFASVYQYEGQLQVYKSGGNSACLRCLWPEATRDGLVGNCSAAGVLGPVPGIFGALQALEALKILLGLPGQLDNELLIYDLTTLESRKLRIERHAPCRNGRCTRITALSAATTIQDSAHSMNLELQFDSLALAAAEGYRIVDIREGHEVEHAPIAGVPYRHIPMIDLLQGCVALDPGQRHLLICAHGVRSLALATELRSRGTQQQVHSLQGGLAAIA